MDESNFYDIQSKLSSIFQGKFDTEISNRTDDICNIFRTVDHLKYMTPEALLKTYEICSDFKNITLLKDYNLSS